jgi:glutamine synthetase
MFAPSKLCWACDNRTSAFRLCGEHSSAVRIECRIGGADLNPYLAFAAIIAAGLAGIDEGKLKTNYIYIFMYSSFLYFFNFFIGF